MSVALSMFELCPELAVLTSLLDAAASARVEILLDPIVDSLFALESVGLGVLPASLVWRGAAGGTLHTPFLQVAPIGQSL